MSMFRVFPTDRKERKGEDRTSVTGAAPVRQRPRTACITTLKSGEERGKNVDRCKRRMFCSFIIFLLI